MGQTLSEPVTSKRSACCKNNDYRVGSSCMQGWRMQMEDCHVHVLSLPEDPGAAFFAVYDGHGGAAVAQYAGKHLHEYIIKQSEYKAGNITDAIRKGFLELDGTMRQDALLKADQAGTTVIALLIKDNVIYSANAGDSRAVASVNGNALLLSQDHKPTLKSERERIEAAGGWVELSRVNGHLALSRALGDFMFKRNEEKPPEEQIVTALPDIQTYEITEDWEFIVLACDGIWDVMTNNEVIDFVRSRLGQTKSNNSAERTKDQTMDPEEICEKLMNLCLAPDRLMGAGCDNMTVVLVCLLHGKPYSHLVSRCRRPPGQLPETLIPHILHCIWADSFNL